VAYAAHQGYDGIWLDLEHRPMGSRELQGLLAFFHHYDIDCLLRPPTREKAILYRYLEDGASGLIIPHIPDAATAAQMVQAVKFPPTGDRGIEGRGLDTDYGLTGNRDTLPPHANAETTLIIQIETPQALANAAEIAALEGVDGLYVGPSDLGLRLQYDASGMSLQQAIEQVAEICREAGKAWGCMPRNIEQVQRYQKMGAQLHVWGIDVKLLMEGLAQAKAELDEIL
jgi:2-keto-3-deoxy-L-rhamnonate aldolase RhmA